MWHFPHDDDLKVCLYDFCFYCFNLPFSDVPFMYPVVFSQSTHTHSLSLFSCHVNKKMCWVNCVCRIFCFNWTSSVFYFSFPRRKESWWGGGEAEPNMCWKSSVVGSSCSPNYFFIHLVFRSIKPFQLPSPNPKLHLTWLRMLVDAVWWHVSCRRWAPLCESLIVGL